ncbi:MAG: glycosyl hydrolase family 18 protein, partial [Planctomycetota bacterium]
YDMAGPWSRTAGHHAPLRPSPLDPQRSWRSVAAAMAYWSEDRGVPREKLVVGIPFYGRAYPVDEPFAELDPAKRKQHGTLTFTQVRSLVGKGWPAEWDAASQSPWLSPPDGKRLLIAYDDRNSVDKKAKWAQKQGYRGLFYWALHQDRMSDGTHWLLRAANRAWPVERAVASSQ